MHAEVLRSLSLGLHKNARLNKGQWAERLNLAKPPNCLHLLNVTSPRPGGTVYPSDILHCSFRQIWMQAPVCLKWYKKAPPISSPMAWNNASSAHPHCISSLYLDKPQIRTTATAGFLTWVNPAAADPPGWHRWRYGWLNPTHTPTGDSIWWKHQRVWTWFTVGNRWSDSRETQGTQSCQPEI